MNTIMESARNSSASTTAAVATASAVLVTAAAAVWYLNSTKKGVKRRWSFTSRAMALGSFPPEANYPDPVINAVLLFHDSCPTAEEVLEKVVSKMLEYDRLNTIYDDKLGTGKKVDFDPSDLVRVLPAVDAKDDAALMVHLNDHFMPALSEGTRGQLLPWWELVIVPNKKKGCPSAILWRSQHALADGLSMVNIVQDIITDMEGNQLESILPAGMKKKFKIQRSLWDKVKGVANAFGSFQHMMQGPYDDKTTFAHSASRDMIFQPRRSVLCFEPIPLDFVKAMKTAANVSLNDVVYTCISQAIHDYLIEQDDPALKEKGKDLLCRTLMALAFPPANNDKATCLRNQWCFVSADFGIGTTDDVLERLHQVHDSLSELKKSLVPFLIMTSQNYICPHLPLFFNRNQVYGLFTRHSAVFSNVPGPPVPVQFAGHEVHGVQMVFPNLVPQVGLISYRGQIFGNFCLDPVAIPNAHRIPILVTKAYLDLATKLEVAIPNM